MTPKQKMMLAAAVLVVLGLAIFLIVYFVNKDKKHSNGNGNGNGGLVQQKTAAGAPLLANPQQLAAVAQSLMNRRRDYDECDQFPVPQCPAMTVMTEPVELNYRQS